MNRLYTNKGRLIEKQMKQTRLVMMVWNMAWAVGMVGSTAQK